MIKDRARLSSVGERGGRRHSQMFEVKVRGHGRVMQDYLPRMTGRRGHRVVPQTYTLHILISTSPPFPEASWPWHTRRPDANSS